MLHSFRSLNFAQTKTSDKQFSRCSKQKVAWCYYLSHKFGLHNTGGALSCFLTNFFDTPHAYQKAGEIIFISKEKKAREVIEKNAEALKDWRSYTILQHRRRTWTKDNSLLKFAFYWKLCTYVAIIWQHRMIFLFC